MESTTKIICSTISGIVTALVLGEVFGNCISRPISAWRGVRYTLPSYHARYPEYRSYRNIKEKEEEEEAE